VARDLNLFLATSRRFAKIQRDVGAHIAAGLLPTTAATPAASSSAAAAEHIAEDAAERFEDIVDVAEVGRATLRTVDAGVAEPIVTAALFFIAENFVSLGRFLELPDGFGVAGVFIGMILNGELAIRRRNLAIRGGLRDLQHFVVAALRRRHISLDDQTIRERTSVSMSTTHSGTRY
jgi:hypothetical protein